MVYAPGSKTEEPIVTAASREIRTVLSGRLGATLVESADPLWKRDPDVEAMTTDFRRALTRLVPVIMPDLLFRLRRDGRPLFKELAAAIVPTEFAPGKTFGAGSMQPIDYCVALAEGGIAPPVNFDIATIQEQELAMAFRFHVPQYLSRRAADWRTRGFTETLVDFAALNARSKFWGDDGRAAFKNWEEVADPRNPLGRRQGVDERIMLRELLRRVDMMVLIENRLDALVRLHTPFPPGKIGGAYQPGLPGNLRLETFYGPNAGLTEVLVPAGYVTTVYDPVWALNPEGTRYVPVRSDLAAAALAPAVLAQSIDQVAETRQVVEPVDELLHARHPARAQHHPGQLSKLLPDFGFTVGILIVAARALAEPRHLPAVAERDGDSRRLESRHGRAESGILANCDPPAKRADRGIADDVVREGAIARVAPQHQGGGGVGQRILGGEIVGRIGLAHVRGEAVGRHVDALDAGGVGSKIGGDVLEGVEGRVDRIAARAKPEIVARDLPAP